MKQEGIKQTRQIKGDDTISVKSDIYSNPAEQHFQKGEMIRYIVDIDLR